MEINRDKIFLPNPLNFRQQTPEQQPLSAGFLVSNGKRQNAERRNGGMTEWVWFFLLQQKIEL